MKLQSALDLFAIVLSKIASLQGAEVEWNPEARDSAIMPIAFEASLR